MKKNLSLLLIVLLICSLFNTMVFAAATFKAKPVQVSILLDGKTIWCTGFSVSGYNYFSIRNLAENMNGTTSQFNVVWNTKNNSIEMTTGKEYKPSTNQKDTYYNPSKYYTAKLITSKIIIDGKLYSIKAYNIDGIDYFQLGDLSKAIHFDMTVDGNKILLYSQMPKNAYRTTSAYNNIYNMVSASFPRWSYTRRSYIVKNKDKTISVIEAEKDVTIETYNDKYSLISKQSLSYELPLFGAFYSGEKYNYIAFGQDNSEQNDNKEVIRIVRYDKSFKRIDSVSIKAVDCYTTIPFLAGCGRIAESGNTLVFHTSRQRYKTEDGKNHQSQLTIIVDTSTMKVTNDLGRFQGNHVSHSFDQFVQFDGNSHVLVDHGDGYPRSIVLQKQDGLTYVEAELFKIPGKIGANCTGVSVGGFEVSSENYIVAMNSINHSLVSEYTSFEMVGLKVDQRDIIICALPKNSIQSDKVKQITLAEYVGSDKIASIPQLVKISEDKMMVLWQEFDSVSRKLGDLKYVIIDKNGSATTEIRSIKNFKLSAAKPAIVDNAVVWYVDENGYRVFYSIPLS